MQRASKRGWAWRGHSRSYGPSALLWLRPPQGLLPQDRPRASGWLGRSSWAPVTVRMTPHGSPLPPPLLSLPQQSKESDTTHPLAPTPLCLPPWLGQDQGQCQELGVEPAPQAGPVSVPGCRWMELGAGQPLALSCPVTPGSCLAAMGLFSYSF